MQVSSVPVSAWITAYNYDRFVVDAVESVLSQQYAGEVECIVVDDGSTDDTPRVLAPFRDRIVYIRQPNRGQAGAFNTAFARSQGEIVCLLDADDRWVSSKVQKVADAFARDPALGLVHHGMEIVDRKGSPVEGLFSSFRPADGDVSGWMRKKVLPYPFSCASGVSLSREAANWVFPLSERQKGHADGLIATSAALLAPVRYLDEKLAVYQVHGDNLWAVGQLARIQGSGDELGRIRHFVTDLEDKVDHANQVLKRAGRLGGLSPWMNWTYIKYRSFLKQERLQSCLPRVWNATMTCPCLSFKDRMEVMITLTRRSLRSWRWGRQTEPSL